MNPVPPLNAGSLTRERHRAKSALIHGTLLTITRASCACLLEGVRGFSRHRVECKTRSTTVVGTTLRCPAEVPAQLDTEPGSPDTNPLLSATAGRGRPRHGEDVCRVSVGLVVCDAVVRTNRVFPGNGGGVGPGLVCTVTQRAGGIRWAAGVAGRR